MKLLSALAPLCLVLTCATGHAALLAYDGFDSTSYNAVAAPTGGYRNHTTGPSNALFYDDDLTRNNSASGSIEVGQNPATYGFTDPWNYGSNLSSSVYARLEPTQLSYAGLTTTLGQLNLQRSASSSASGKSFSRSLNVGPSTGFGAELYIGGLIQRTSDTTFSLSMAFVSGSDSRSISMSIAADGIGTLTGYGAPTVTSDSPIWATGVPQFFVLKLENSVLDGVAGGTVGDRMSLYINPDLSNEAANTPALVLGDEDAGFFVTGNSAWTINGINIASNLAAAGQSVIFDEFKIGTQWADMMATIPEPSTGVLAMMPLLLAFRRRR